MPTFMKKFTKNLILLLCFFLVCPPIAFCKTSPPAIHASGAILLDSKTGQILFEKNAYKQLAPASTTKIMTAILAIESGRLDEKTIISKNAANTSGSTIHLHAGQTFALRELLTGLMLRSGNDCAVAIAEFIAGSEDAFVNKMNEKAAAIGATTTTFQNPHGLPAENHISTAYDLAWITRYAMALPEFAEIVNTRHANIDFEDSRGNSKEQNLKNTNKLLWMLEEADGVKTGTTNEAGPCLVSSATRDNQRLIAVTLDDKQRWQDSQQLLQWGFDNYRLYEYGNADMFIDTVEVKSGFKDSLDLALAEDAALVVDADKIDLVTVAIDRPDKVKAPVYQGQKIGTLYILVEDQPQKSIDLIAQTNIEEKSIVRLLLNQLTLIFKFFSELGII